MKYIYQHLGLGDHLVCNGLVRNLVARVPKEQYCMFVKPQYMPSVVQMYSDVSNLHFIPGNDDTARSMINGTNSVVIGHCFPPKWIDDTQSCERNYYLQHGVDFAKKWDDFKCSRNLSKEATLTSKLWSSGDYIFVHDDARFRIDPSRLPTGILHIRPFEDYSISMIDYAGLIQNAKEVHCIESCFGFMTDLMALNPNFYLHRYPRYLTSMEVPEYKTAKDILQ